MSRNCKEIKNGRGTTLYINGSDYFSVCAGGKDVLLRCADTILAFDSFADLVAAIDTTKAAWHDRYPADGKITKALIRDGIRAKLIRFVTDPNLESGTVCRIGDNWFYFGGMTAEELSPEEYVANVPVEDTVSDIYATLEAFRQDEEYADEYNYYYHALLYCHDMAN